MTKPIATFSEFISIPELLGNDFEGPSWDSWRVTMKGALGEEMNEVERIRFRGLAGRDPPPGRVRELWLAIGRRAGKDSIAAALATYLAVFSDFRRYCRRGERATVMCLAVDRPQAGIVFRYIRANRGTGKDTVDHPRGDHDDLINAAAGALTLAGKRNPLVIHPDVLRRSAMPLGPRAWGRYARKRDSDGFWFDTWLS